MTWIFCFILNKFHNIALFSFQRIGMRRTNKLVDHQPHKHYEEQPSRGKAATGMGPNHRPFSHKMGLKISLLGHHINHPLEIGFEEAQERKWIVFFSFEIKMSRLSKMRGKIVSILILRQFYFSFNTNRLIFISNEMGQI